MIPLASLRKTPWDSIPRSESEPIGFEREEKNEIHFLVLSNIVVALGTLAPYKLSLFVDILSP